MIVRAVQQHIPLELKMECPPFFTFPEYAQPCVYNENKYLNSFINNQHLLSGKSNFYQHSVDYIIMQKHIRIYIDALGKK